MNSLQIRTPSNTSIISIGDPCTAQTTNSISLNASGAPISGSVGLTGCCYIKPIRNLSIASGSTGGFFFGLYYNVVTNEICYSSSSGISSSAGPKITDFLDFYLTQSTPGNNGDKYTAIVRSRGFGLKFKNFRGPWNMNGTYVTGDTALFQPAGSGYSPDNIWIIGKTSSTVANGIPGVEPSWILVTRKFSVSPWNSLTQYVTGDIVFAGDEGTIGTNLYYYAKTDSFNSQPPDRNTNDQWQFLVPNQENTTIRNYDSRTADYRNSYSIGDTVSIAPTSQQPSGGAVRDGKMYICIQQTIINDANTEPLGSQGPNYWALLLTPNTVSF